MSIGLATRGVIYIPRRTLSLVTRGLLPGTVTFPIFPDRPVHITDLKSGDFVRIQLFSRKSMIYKPLGPGGFELVLGTPKKRDRVWDRTILTGGVVSNDAASGILRVGVSNQQSADKVFRATVPYSSIAVISVAQTDIREVKMPVYLRGVLQPPRIKYERVKF